MEAWLSSSVTDARIASLNSMRAQLSARGGRFQEKGTLLAAYEQKLPNGGGGGGGLPNGTPKGTLNGDPTVKVVLSRPLDLIRVVCPSGIPLHFLDFRSGAEIRRPPGSDAAGWPAGRPAQAVWPAPNHKKSTPDHKNMNRPDGPKILV